MVRLVLIILMALAAATAQAREAVPVAQDPALEAHMMRIAQDMRCLECQNETLAASHAGLAKDLRQQIRDMLAQGKSDQDIVDYMVARYGDFVLYKPPFKPLTWLLWGGPFGLLLLAGFAMASTIRRRAGSDDVSELSPQQLLEAHHLLETAPPEGGQP